MTDEKPKPTVGLIPSRTPLTDYYENILPIEAIENLPIMDLHHYQADAVEHLRDDLESGKKVQVMHVPTGAGKAMTAKLLVLATLPCPVCGARDWKASPAGRNAECLNCGVKTTVERLARTHRAENRRSTE